MRLTQVEKQATPQESDYHKEEKATLHLLNFHIYINHTYMYADKDETV